MAGEISAGDLHTFYAVAGDVLGRLGYERGVADARRSTWLGALRTRVGEARRRGDLTDQPVDLRQAGMPRLDRPVEPTIASRGVMERVQDLLDRLVAVFGAGDATALESMLIDSALLRRVAPGLDEGGRDDLARGRFLAEMADVARHRTLDVLSEVVPGVPLSTVVLRAETMDGMAEWDTLVVGVRDDRIDRITWYQPDRRSRTAASSA